MGLTNHNKRDGFFNRSVAKPIVAWLKPVFPRLAAVECFPALGAGGMLRQSLLIGSSRYVCLLRLARLDNYGFRFYDSRYNPFKLSVRLLFIIV